MPGYNQRGPGNMGPMTGRGMGRCVAGGTQNLNRPGMGTGSGMGGGRRCGRGFGAGRGTSPWSGTRFSPSREELTLRAQALEKELETVKQELKNFSDE